MDIVETLFYTGGVILIWAKIGSVVLTIGALLLALYKINKMLSANQKEVVA